MKQKGRKWLFALLLTTPMIVFFLGYLFNHDPSLYPTGFIQYDNVSYIAYAKQYNEAETFSFFYSNPFNDSPAHKPIYFQPQTIFFALLLKAGIPPGWILIPFTLICSLICFRLLIAIFDHLAPLSRYRTIGIWLLAWGGGLLTVAGIFAQLVLGKETVPGIFHLDPGSGWWGLNFGRSLFFSCEALYHALFLAVILCLLKKQWRTAIIVSFILSLSHPFTGMELLGILAAWACVDRFAFRNKEIPIRFVASAVLLLAFHLWYYLSHLPGFDDHRSVSDQYELNWRLRFFSIIPAYCIVGILALLSITKIKPLGVWLKNTENRLLLLWFIIAFMLANHELFMPAKQPIHFTRGYIWTALFLIGLPALHRLLIRYWQGQIKKLVIGILILLFLSDNFLWISLQASGKSKTASITHITGEQKQVLQELKKMSDRNTLIISRDKILPYLSMVYTDANAWISHPFTTPFIEEKKVALDSFIEAGTISSSWKDKKLIFIFRKKDKAEVKREAAMPFPTKRIFESNSIIISEFTP